MNTTEQKAPSSKKAVKLSPRTETLIGEIKSLWGPTQTNYMTLGEHFSQLRAETERYRSSERTGISYAEAVRRTGVPRSTAEFYRSLYETCADFSIPIPVFLALQDNGVNLASERYLDQETRELRKVNVQELRKLDVSDHAAVKAESARGIAPRAAHRSGLEPLDSSGSCHPLKAAACRRDQRVPPVAR